MTQTHLNVCVDTVAGDVRDIGVHLPGVVSTPASLTGDLPL